MESFWAITVNNAVVVCVLAVGALALGRFWKNPAALHLVWVAVLLKLFVPPIYFAHVPGTARLFATAAGTANIVNEQAPATAVTDAMVDQAAIAPIASGLNAASVESNKNSRGGVLSGFSAITSRWFWSLSTICMAMWICGALVVASGYAFRIHRFEKLLREARPATAAIRGMASGMAAKLELQRCPSIVMTGVPLPPLVWSIVGRPRVILPKPLFDRLDRQAQETIVAHELVHVSRRDHRVRLLELAATTLFWWHPVVWFACSKLRALEEHCCDGRVLEIVPHTARDYAATLVDTMAFLSEQSPVAVPLPTAASTGALARRICMLTQAGTYRLSAGSAFWIAMIVAVPMTIALAAEEPKPSIEAAKEGPVAVAAAMVTGRVTNDAGEGLADVRVKVAIPAADMRFVYSETTHKIRETTTDKDGNYKLELPEITKPTKVSLDATKPGYRTLVGMLMQLGDIRKFEVSPGTTVTQSFSLPPAAYLKGTVVDEQGKPIAGVNINAILSFNRSSGGIQLTASDEHGSFEIFNYPLKAQADKQFNNPKGRIHFNHPYYIHRMSDDIYALTPEEQANMRVLLAAGHHIAGRVLDSNGQPVSAVMVETNKNNRKAVMTDGDGRFNLRGLADGQNEVQAHAMKLREKAKTPVDLNRDVDDFVVRLQPIVLKTEPTIVNVLGMKLADVTPELVSVYDLYHSQGALILDPGKDFDRLGIGNLVEGYCFWMARQDRISGVRQFLEQILAEFATENGAKYGCRVVYAYENLESRGNNTQHLHLTMDDLEEIRKVLAELDGK